MQPRSRPTIEEVPDEEHWSIDATVELEVDEDGNDSVTDTEGMADSQSDWFGDEGVGMHEQASMRDELQETDDEGEWVDEEFGEDDEVYLSLPPSSDVHPSPRRSSPVRSPPRTPHAIPFPTNLSPSIHFTSSPPSSPTPGARGTALQPAAISLPTPGSVSRTLVATSSARFPASVTQTPATSSRINLQRLLDEEGMVYSSPIKGTPQTKAKLRAKKARKQQALKIRKQEEAKRLVSAHSRAMKCEAVISLLASCGLRFVDLMKFVFDPAMKQGTTRWQGFFVKRGAATKVLNWWTSSKNSKSGRAEVNEWAVGHVANLVAKEARRITEGGMLQAKKVPVNTDLVSSFKLEDYSNQLVNNWAPVAMRIISAFSTSRHAKTHSKKRKEKTEIVKTMVALTSLGEYSRDNNIPKRMFTLYLYTSGAQRQVINVVSKVGFAESYSAMLSTRLRKIRRKKTAQQAITSTPADIQHPASADAVPSSSANPTAPPGLEEGKRLGSLYQLSDSVREEARQIAATGLYAVVYDNINMNFANPEQILGRHDTQENGTCATLFTLNGPASVKDLDAKVLQQAFLDAPELSLDDILLNEEEQDDIGKNLVATILRVIVEYGGEGFKVFQADMDQFQPQTSLKVEPQKTKLFPLPAWNIDESSITGNVEVNNAIVEELELDKDPSFGDRARILAGDQLTIARLRSIETMRAGNEHGYEGFAWGVHILGLFHTKIADIHGLLLTHFGKPDTGTANPGSLWFHNTCLDRLPITLTSLPPLRTCRDLVMVSLYARVLECLLLVSSCDSLEGYMQTFGTWDQLVLHAQEIYTRYAQGSDIQSVRWSRKMEMNLGVEEPRTGDMVFENAVLFMRDALISREFHDAIKANDPGRIVPILKLFALSFRGTKRLKYAYEMLFIVHHIKHIWPAGVRRIVFNNMVLNPSGLPESGVECDLVQEHMNLLSKTKYKARGPNSTWEWMYIITPCTNALRALQGNINQHLGNDLGLKHANAQLDADIRCLMESLHDHKVYIPQPGRVIAYEDAMVDDVIDVGMAQLSSDLPTSPLAEYNAAFRRLQKRRRMTPVTKPPSPVLNATELPEFGGRIFPKTPSPPLSSAGDQSPVPSQRDEASPSSIPCSDTQAPEVEPLSRHSPTSDELLDEIAETREDADPGDPLLQGELQMLMDNVENEVEDVTLRRESMRDVALDMDAVDSDDENEWDSESSGSDSDYAP